MSFLHLWHFLALNKFFIRKKAFLAPSPLPLPKGEGKKKILSQPRIRRAPCRHGAIAVVQNPPQQDYSPAFC